MPAPPRKQARDEIDLHLGQGDLVKAARAALREHWRQADGKVIAPEIEFDAAATGNLRDALAYLEAGNYELAMHHAWRAQVYMAKRGRVAGVECLDEQGVWQCIEMCKGAAETRDAAIRDKDQAVRERDEAHGARLHAEGRRSLAESQRDNALREAAAARAEASAARASARSGNTASAEAK